MSTADSLSVDATASNEESIAGRWGVLQFRAYSDRTQHVESQCDGSYVKLKDFIKSKSKLPPTVLQTHITCASVPKVHKGLFKQMASLKMTDLARVVRSAKKSREPDPEFTVYFSNDNSFENFTESAGKRQKSQADDDTVLKMDLLVAVLCGETSAGHTPVHITTVDRKTLREMYLGLINGTLMGCPTKKAAKKAAEGSAEESAEGPAEGSAEGLLEGSAQGLLEGFAEGSAEGSGDLSLEGSTKGLLKGSAEGSAEAHPEASAVAPAGASAEASAKASAEASAKASTEKGPPWRVNMQASFPYEEGTALDDDWLRGQAERWSKKFSFHHSIPLQIDDSAKGGIQISDYYGMA